MPFNNPTVDAAARFRMEAIEAIVSRNPRGRPW